MPSNRQIKNGSVDVTPPGNGSLNDPDLIENTILVTAGGKVTAAGVINALYGCTASKNTTGVYEVEVPYDSAIYTFAVATICADFDGGTSQKGMIHTKEPTSAGEDPWIVYTFDELGVAADRPFTIVFYGYKTV